MSKRLLRTLAVGAMALGASACGGSSAAPGVVPAPSAGATAASSTSPTKPTTPTTPTTPPTPTTPTTPTKTVSTPASGPLSTKPTVKVPKGPAPKQLVTKDLIKGHGKAAAEGSTITVNYVGVLYSNGTEFDSSWSRHTTFSTPLSSSSVIPGWVKGIAGMKVGGRRELIIPPNLAYGSSGQSGIPPNSTLIFVVDLLAVS
jgi:peptidylprolyl isomerase